MKMDDMYPSIYLKPEEVDENKGIVRTIDYVELHEFTNDGKTEKKPVMFFKEGKNPNAAPIDRKGLILKKKNASILKEMYGDDTAAWEGKRILLVHDIVFYMNRPFKTLVIKFAKDRGQQAPAAEAATVQEPELTGESDDLPF